MVMPETIYILCALTSLFCAVLLWRSYRRSRTKLLMWSTLCFFGLAINNALLVIDLVVVPDADLALVRGAVALGSMLMLLIGLIWEES
jgi:hydrogenase/urease accessory protein HupE